MLHQNKLNLIRINLTQPRVICKYQGKYSRRDNSESEQNGRKKNFDKIGRCRLVRVTRKPQDLRTLTIRKELDLHTVLLQKIIVWLLILGVSIINWHFFVDKLPISALENVLSWCARSTKLVFQRPTSNSSHQGARKARHSH